MAKCIKLLGEPIQTENDKAAAAITPGMLVEQNGSSDLIPHGTATGYAQRNFALEREEGGRDIDTAYAVGDYVKVGAFAPGDHVNALIASGETVNEDQYVESNGDGTVQAGTTSRVGRALETVVNTAGPGMARLRIEIV